MSDIKLICINSKNIPKEIPLSKHLKEGDEYTLIYVWWSEGSKCWAFDIAEIELDESCNPYSFYRGDRFGIRQEDLAKFEQFMKDCSIDVGIEQLMEESQLELV